MLARLCGLCYKPRSDVVMECRASQRPKEPRKTKKQVRFGLCCQEGVVRFGLCELVLCGLGVKPVGLCKGSMCNLFV